MQKLTTICRLVSEAFDLPLFILNNQSQILFATSHLPEQSILRSGADFFAEADGSLDQIDLKTTMYSERFFLFSAGSEEKIAGGPCLHEKITDLRLGGLAEDLAVSQAELKEYCRHLPVISRKTFLSAAEITYFMVHGKKGKLGKPKNPDAAEHPELQLSQRKQELLFHHDLSEETKLLSAIQKGKKEEVEKMLEKIPSTGELGVLSKSSYLRSQKNLAIAAITLATRAAMEGGVDSETAYTMSDTFIQRLEELSNADEVWQLIREALGSFTDRVQQARISAVSPVIARCQQWIYQHIYEPFQLSELAEQVHLSPAYLSSSFKKETGMTLSDWIQKARVEEAANLLLLSNYDIADICTWLQFSDQSYFTKVFKKHTGQTPAVYRKENRKT